MRLDRITKLLLVMIFLAAMAHVAVTVFAPTATQAQVPQVLIARATDNVASANEEVAQSLERLASAVRNSNLRIAEAIRQAAR